MKTNCFFHSTTLTKNDGLILVFSRFFIKIGKNHTLFIKILEWKNAICLKTDSGFESSIVELYWLKQALLKVSGGFGKIIDK